jgi:hypothetical protein
MAGFDIINTVADLKRDEYEEDMAHKLKKWEAEYNNDLHAM